MHERPGKTAPPAKRRKKRRRGHDNETTPTPPTHSPVQILSNSQQLSPEDVMTLQRTMGNHATMQLLQQRPELAPRISTHGLLPPRRAKNVQRDVTTTEAPQTTTEQQDDLVEQDNITENNDVQEDTDLPDRDDNEQQMQQGFGFEDDEVEDTLDPEAQSAYDKFESLYNDYLYYN